jgi:glycerol-3-phosphate O-acyltransferase
VTTQPRRGLRYRLTRALIARVARPKLGSRLPVAPPGDLVYVLEYRSLSDLVMLDLVCEELTATNPLQAVDSGEHLESRRFFFLNRPGKGLLRRNTMARHSERMTRLLDHASAWVAQQAKPEPDALPALVPVMVQWGRAPNREGSLWRLLISENWAVTSRLRRFLNLFLNRHDIVVSFGHALPLVELASDELPLNRLQRRCARLLRVQLRDLRLSAMGPDFSHRRTLTSQVVGSRRVRETISELAAARAASKETAPDQPREARKEARRRQRAERALERKAEAHARSIFSNMSYATVRVLERLLRWFWNRIYAGVTVQGLEQLSQQVEGHTVIYVPSHRSHVDYLLLSYLLFQHGRMIPHIAAGDNLNLPVVGRILRRGGAFFMRRSFRGDPLYASVFSEYLYQVYRRGHCVEFFTEGGRSRTGRLLPPRVGLLRITLEHWARGLPRPISFVPVYFSYEKLIEAGAYLDQLKGGAKEQESLGGVMRSWRLIRQDFGKVIVNVGEPLQLDEWLAQDETAAAQAPDHGALATALGTELHRRINDAAVLNPVNMVALVTVATPRLAIERSVLAAQVELYRTLLEADQNHHAYSLPAYTGQEAIDEVLRLGFVQEEHSEIGDIISHDSYTAVLMTWYRNNVTHTLALPALTACLLAERRRPIARSALLRMLRTLYPFLAIELSTATADDAYERQIKHLLQAGLLREEDSWISTPDLATQASAQLGLLAQIVMPTLERMYIVIAQLSLAEPGSLDRASLRSRSQNIAKKLSRLLGLNAPEFFDGRLFDQFILALIEHGRVTEDADDKLHATETVLEVIRAATTVIDRRFVQAVQRAA